MGATAGIENIAEMRRRAGIDDVELRESIADIEPGDLVQLTFLPDSKLSGGETLAVRVNGIKGSMYRGVLVEAHGNAELTELEIGALVVFTAGHIHALPREAPAHGK